MPVLGDGLGNVGSSVDLTTEVTGVLPITNGGTNSSTALNNERAIISQSGKLVEAGATRTITANATIAAADFNKLVVFNSASAITVTLPQQSTEATTTSFECDFFNINTGLVSFQAEGAESKDGNSTCAQYAGGRISRPTTTKWGIFGGTATVNLVGVHEDVGAITTSQTIVLMGYVGAACTLLGVYQKARALTTAGTFAIKKNGTSLSGLGSVVPSTAGSYTTATGTGSDNVLARGDQITIVADGTLVGVLDLGLSLDLTMNF